MKNFIKSKKTVVDKRPIIKIQLNHKTLVTVRSMDVFNTWKLNFPDARIVN